MRARITVIATNSTPSTMASLIFCFMFRIPFFVIPRKLCYECLAYFTILVYKIPQKSQMNRYPDNTAVRVKGTLIFIKSFAFTS